MPHREKSYTREEEIANSVSHGLGALMSVLGLIVLVFLAARRADAWTVVSVSLFSASLILLYSVSTFYHGFPSAQVKNIFRKLDHAAIYFLIAGTYTPFVLVNLRGPWGWTLFGLVWGLGCLGILFEVLLRRPPKWLSLGFYLALSWLIAIAVKPLLQAVPEKALLYLLLGGIAYTLGTVFYAWKKLPYHHAVWHLFVLLGSTMHFFAVYFAVIPQ